MNLSLGESAAGCDRGLDLDLDVDPGVVQQFEDFSGAVGAVAVDRRIAAGCGVGGRVGEVADQLGGGFGVAGVARGDLDAGDDLAVRVEGEVAFVAVEAVVAGPLSGRASRPSRAVSKA